MDKRTDLYLLSGFLGAGKTTFLKEILKSLEDKKTGVIMNEFGKVSIDGPIIQKDGLKLTEINRGSIFCSCLKLNFIQAMIEMAKYNLDYLFVESSGLADPSNIGDVLYGLEGTEGDVYNYKGCICIVDGLNFLDQIKELETVERQIKHCHLVVISKIDLIEQDTLSKIIEKIKEINPKADIQLSSFGKIEKPFTKMDLMKNQWAESEESLNKEENKPKTLHLTYTKSIDKKDLSKFIDKISADTYRIKGFFQLHDGWHQVDVVNRKIDYKVCEPKNTSQLVIISKIGPQIIRSIFSAWNDIIGDEMKLR